MKMNRIFSFVVLSIALLACGRTPEGQTVAVETPSGEAVAGTSFGEEFTPQDVVAFAQLSGQVSASDSVSLVVQGKVNAVCQAKGCWMTMMAPSGEEMMVRFKDYAFFMPKDIADREVIVNGKAFYQTTTVDELRHYAEDAGKSAEEVQAITEPKQELRFYADGVILLEE